MKINAPAKDYTATDHYGELKLEFKNGTAEVDKLPPGVRQYLLGAGYGIDEESTVAETPAPADPRDATHDQLGTPLRDAAVDPKPGDFLPPTNAGKPGEEGNPHGPNVVSPEIHASQGVRPVKAGEVHVDDTDKQEASEQAHTEQATSGEPVTGVEAPAGNASTEAWHEYALTQGKTSEELEGLGQRQIRDLFTEKTE